MLMRVLIRRIAFVAVGRPNWSEPTVVSIPEYVMRLKTFWALIDQLSVMRFESRKLRDAPAFTPN